GHRHVRGRAPDVPERKGDLARQLALDVERELLYAPLLVVLVDEVDAAADVRQEAERVPGGRPDAAREGILNSRAVGRGQTSVGGGDVVGRGGVAERAEGGGAGEEQRQWSIEDPVAGPDHGLGIHAVGETDARLEFGLLRI